MRKPVAGKRKTARTRSAGIAIDKSSMTIGGDFVGRDKISRSLPVDISALLQPIIHGVAASSSSVHAEAMQQIDSLKVELAKGRRANDGRVAKILDDLAGLVPGAVAGIVSAFGSPILAGMTGPVTSFVLDKLRGR